MSRRILLLGGVGDALAIARRLGPAHVYSLAGLGKVPQDLACQVRVGGFGGAEGLARFIAEAGIDLLLDVTHPYAARISANAAQGAGDGGCRAAAAEWIKHESARWTTGLDQQFEQRQRLLRGIPRALIGHVVDGGDVQHVGGFLELPSHALARRRHARRFEVVVRAARVEQDVVMLAREAPWR